mgnify:FL=1
MNVLFTVLVTFFAGMGAGLGTGFAGMSAAAVISPMLITFLHMDPYMAVGIALSSDVLASAVSAYTYHKNKNLDIKNGLIMMASVLVFTVVGSWVASRVPSATMGGFSVFMTFLLGIKFIVRPVMTTKEAMQGVSAKKRAIQSIVCGVLIGFICGFIGAGVSGATTKVNHTSVQVSDREVAQVQTVKVDGKTQMTMPEVYASNVNSVVSINVSATTNYFGQTVQTAASGTGFFITEDGYILTNHHVISDASSVKVTLYNGETYDAKVIGSDEDYDIAVLKIDVTGATPVVLGDSSKVAIGESVAAVGNPLGELTFSMSEGIVSCVNRAVNVDGTPFNMIQVDCSINPGNSGGPLFNSYGEVIGIVSAKYSSYSNTTVEGIGFAIPINDVLSLVKDIMTNGYVTSKAYMGITPQTMNAQMAQQYRYDVTEGVFVCSVDPDSAADKAGLKLGDVITKMDDKDIASYEDLVAAKKAYTAGDTVTLTVYRGGETIEVPLTFDAVPESAETNNSDQSTDNSYNGNGGYGNGGNGYYSNPWDFFNNFFGYNG